MPQWHSSSGAGQARSRSNSRVSRDAGSACSAEQTCARSPQSTRACRRLPPETPCRAAISRGAKSAPLGRVSPRKRRQCLEAMLHAKSHSPRKFASMISTAPSKCRGGVQRRRARKGFFGRCRRPSSAPRLLRRPSHSRGTSELAPGNTVPNSMLSEPGIGENQATLERNASPRSTGALALSGLHGYDDLPCPTGALRSIRGRTRTRVASGLRWRSEGP
jgi:hypothetical protein